MPCLLQIQYAAVAPSGEPSEQLPPLQVEALLLRADGSLAEVIGNSQRTLLQAPAADKNTFLHLASGLELWRAEIDAGGRWLELRLGEQLLDRRKRFTLDIIGGVGGSDLALIQADGLVTAILEGGGWYSAGHGISGPQLTIAPAGVAVSLERAPARRGRRSALAG